MKLSPSDLRLYAVTDRRALPVGVTLAQAVEAALDGGVTCLQLREKDASAGELLALARTPFPLCPAPGVPPGSPGSVMIWKSMEFLPPRMLSTYCTLARVPAHSF